LAFNVEVWIFSRVNFYLRKDARLDFENELMGVDRFVTADDDTIGEGTALEPIPQFVAYVIHSGDEFASVAIGQSCGC
jgi:hypothetical protein